MTLAILATFAFVEKGFISNGTWCMRSVPDLMSQLLTIDLEAKDLMYRFLVNLNSTEFRASHQAVSSAMKLFNEDAVEGSHTA